ncbi:late secretory pathway protein AVL9 homolog isoform X2 [Lingula anatina]|uniref:Late secretory pathway protein AVL9 homolog isoform X2 n=1 Tax=Lingula anatina TaxID=7574 RepID=A0A1S3JGA2_LINAN|nr:late secretory pathway protein AVL9 homolog isoform X2 [Lingula anatina]|eukprot:XP_013409171.1 late secretory pathway protein AVL9 homolog isoform X2 [Lingula anatina]
MAASESTDGPVLHVIVVGFHHKKGCQVEYSYPPLIKGEPVDSHEVPDEWKHLPSLALPDGAHNYEKDTIFFHLKAQGGRNDTVYGVSCYRQIDATHLVNRTADVTRSTVQKSVCVLSTLPLYSILQSKLELITHAYFDQGDFTIVSLLEDTYKHLNACLEPCTIDGSRVFVGLSARDVVLMYRYKILVLFKLVLLERKVLFYMSPVKMLCSVILSLLSLFPGLVECGLKEAATYTKHRQVSPTLHSTSAEADDSGEEFLEIKYRDSKNSPEINLKSKSSESDAVAPVLEGQRSPGEGQSDVGQRSPGEGRDERSPGEGQSASKSDIDWKEDHYGQISVDCTQIHSKSMESVSKNNRSQGVKNGGQTSVMEDRVRAASDPLHIVDDYYATSGNQSGWDTAADQKVDTDHQHRHHTWAHDKAPDLNPLNIESITHKENLQTHDKLYTDSSILEESPTKDPSPDPLGNIEAITRVSPVQNQSYRMDDSIEGNMDLQGLEDLDSPESLRQIDSEDNCFSWNEDRSMLQIKDEAEEKGGDHQATPENSGTFLGTKVEEPQEINIERGTSEDGVFMTAMATAAAASQKMRNKRNVIFRKPSDEVAEINHTKQDGEEKDASAGTDAKSKPELIHSDSVSSDKSTSSNISAKLRESFSLAFSSSVDWVKRREEPESPNSPTRLKVKVRPMSPINFVVDECGFPLSIFTKGSLCHPYLSLQFLDLLEEVNVRSFVIGATNVLFRQKKHLTDVIVETEESKITIHDSELKRQLALSTADLRFADYLLKTVEGDSTDAYLDGTSWEGGDEWVRVQFKVYLMSLLATVQKGEQKQLEDFNLHFVNAFKTTHNYKVWTTGQHPEIDALDAGHPFQGSFNIADMRLKVATSLQSSERGKKVNAAVSNTGKAVGGAFSSAKTAVSSWFSGLTSSNKQQ